MLKTMSKPYFERRKFMQGQVNHVQLSQLLGCIEVAIEDVINAVEGAFSS